MDELPPSQLKFTLEVLAGIAIAAAVAWMLHITIGLTWWLCVPLGLLVPWSIPIFVPLGLWRNLLVIAIAAAVLATLAWNLLNSD